MNEAAEELESLTVRERQVLVLLSKGLSRVEIGEHMSLTANTVDTHCKHIKKRLNMTLIEAAVLAAKAGWV